MTKKRTIIYTLVGVLLVAVCAGGLFLWTNKKQTTQDLSKSNLPKDYIELDKNYNKAQRIIKYVKPYEAFMITNAMVSRFHNGEGGIEISNIYENIDIDNIKTLKPLVKDAEGYVENHYEKFRGISDNDVKHMALFNILVQFHFGRAIDSILKEEKIDLNTLENHSKVNADEQDKYQEFMDSIGEKFLINAISKKVHNSTDYDTITKAMGYNRKKVLSEIEKYSEDGGRNTYLEKLGQTKIIYLSCTPKISYYYNEIQDRIEAKVTWVAPKSSDGYLYGRTGYYDFYKLGLESYTFDFKGNLLVGDNKLNLEQSVSKPLNLPKFTPENLEIDKIPTKEYVTQLSNKLFNITYEEEDTVFANSYPIGEDVTKQLPHYTESSSESDDDSDDDYYSDNKELDGNSVVPFKDADSSSATIITSDDVLPEYNSFTNDFSRYLVTVNGDYYSLTFKNKVLTNIANLAYDKNYINSTDN